MSSSSLASELLDSEIRGPHGVTESLRKLWDGFCFPSEDKIVNENMGGGGGRGRRADKDALLHSMTARTLPETFAESKATAAQEEPSTQMQRKRAEIVVTNQGRRKRVIRGLEVALVALASVVATLYTLHRMGYVADLEFTRSSSKISNRLGLPSRPLIKIKKNIKAKLSARTRSR